MKSARSIKCEGQGNRSWLMLKLGCELLLEIANTNKSRNVQASTKTFARKSSEATGLNFQELLYWVEKMILFKFL